MLVPEIGTFGDELHFEFLAYYHTILPLCYGNYNDGGRCNGHLCGDEVDRISKTSHSRISNLYEQRETVQIRVMMSEL